MNNYCTAPSKHPVHCGCDVGLMDCADMQKVAMSKMSDERKEFAADMRTLKDVTGAISLALDCFDGERWYEEEACSGINLESLFVVWKLGRASSDPKGSFSKHMEYMERCTYLQKTIDGMNEAHRESAYLRFMDEQRTKLQTKSQADELKTAYNTILAQQRKINGLRIRIILLASMYVLAFAAAITQFSGV